MDTFLADVNRVSMKRRSNCIVAVSEGIHYADGTFVSEAKTSGTDGFWPCPAGRPGCQTGRCGEGRHRRQSPAH
ncbi:MAG: hypothetical protein ACLU9S_07730 [Oscillospiraceae bacterium]